MKNLEWNDVKKTGGSTKKDKDPQSLGQSYYCMTDVQTLLSKGQYVILEDPVQFIMSYYEFTEEDKSNFTE